MSIRWLTVTSLLVAIAFGVVTSAVGRPSTSGQGRRAARKPAAPAGRRVVPAAPPGLRLTRFQIRSSAVHRTLTGLLVQPRHSSPRRGLVLFLHADHGTEESTLSPELFAALRRLGRRAPSMLFVGGGQRSYWHDRAGEAWARYVLDEMLPAALRRTGVNPRRVVLAGISMGAYGALDLARGQATRFCAVVAHSPVLWRRWRPAERQQPGGFDDREDFERHDLMRLAKRRPQVFARRPVWLDVGRDDGLARPGVMAFARRLRRGGVRVILHAGWSGGHNGAYWLAHWDRYLDFDVAALRACGRWRATQP